MRLLWAAAGLCFYLAHLAHGKLVNVTVDDTLGDPLTGASFTYLPADNWNQGNQCAACTARPDAASAYQGTWHDGTFNSVAGGTTEINVVLTASVPFNGTAVYVYCIIAHTLVAPDGNTDMSFYIDGNLVGTFVEAPTGALNYDYNVLVYSNTSMPAGLHTLTLQSGHVNGLKSLVMLDSLVYTYDDGILPVVPVSSSSTVPVILTTLPIITSSTSSTAITSTTSSVTTSLSSIVTSNPPTPTTLITGEETGTQVGVATSPVTNVTSAKKSSAGPIVGAVVGVIGAIAIAGLAFLCIRKRRQTDELDGRDVFEPAVHNSQPPATWSVDGASASLGNNARMGQAQHRQSTGPWNGGAAAGIGAGAGAGFVGGFQDRRDSTVSSGDYARRTTLSHTTRSSGFPETPAAYSQPSMAYAQTSAYPHPSTYQPPSTYQQPSMYQQPSTYQQPSKYQQARRQSTAYQQPSMYQQSPARGQVLTPPPSHPSRRSEMSESSGGLPYDEHTESSEAQSSPVAQHFGQRQQAFAVPQGDAMDVAPPAYEGGGSGGQPSWVQEKRGGLRVASS